MRSWFAIRWFLGSRCWPVKKYIAYDIVDLRVYWLTLARLARAVQGIRASEPISQEASPPERKPGAATEEGGGHHEIHSRDIYRDDPGLHGKGSHRHRQKRGKNGQPCICQLLPGERRAAWVS